MAGFVCSSFQSLFSKFGISSRLFLSKLKFLNVIVRPFLTSMRTLPRTTRFRASSLRTLDVDPCDTDVQSPLSPLACSSDLDPLLEDIHCSSNLRLAPLKQMINTNDYLGFFEKTEFQEQCEDLLKLVHHPVEAAIYHAILSSILQYRKFPSSVEKETLEALLDLPFLNSIECTPCRICECNVPKEYLHEHSRFCRDVHVSFHELMRNSRKLKCLLDVASEDPKIYSKCLMLINNRNPLSDEILSYIEDIRKFCQEVPCRGKSLIISISSLLRKHVELIYRIRVLMLAFRATQVSKPYNEVNFSTFQSLPECSHSARDFEILKPIARGAYGKVFLCKKQSTGDLFAVKCIEKPDLKNRNGYAQVMAERDSMMQVVSSHVVRLFFTFQADNTLYLVMEFMPGGDLFALLEQVGSLPEETAKFYAGEIAATLLTLHSQGIVHRDLKPDNLMIDEDGHIKLGDFGLSKMAFSKEEDSGVTAAGTPAYVAPEILTGKKATYAADWWSFGVILYEMVEGAPPFVGDTPEEVFKNAMECNYEWTVDVSDSYRDLVDKLLRVNPEERLKGQDVLKHPCFSGAEWSRLDDRPAPFTPQRRSSTDLSYFEASRYSMANSFSMNDLISLADKTHGENYYNLWDGVNFVALYDLNMNIIKKMKAKTC